MVTLNRIYTRTGDDGTTRLASGAPVSKTDPRVEAYGTVDETNAAIGLARRATASDTILDPILARVQNELFDLGSDLATPASVDDKRPVLRLLEGQVDRLETEIDQLNSSMAELTSFVLPGGSQAAAALHMARTICRRAERCAVALADREPVSPTALKYLNRLSDLLFVAARYANDEGRSDVPLVARSDPLNHDVIAGLVPATHGRCFSILTRNVSVAARWVTGTSPAMT